MPSFLKAFGTARTAVTLLLFCFALQTRAVTTNSTPLFELSAVVPKGKCDLEFMTLKISERGTELMAKFQRAVAANRDWFMEYVKNAPEGPLPYDKRLGLTEAEYAEYLGELENRHLGSMAIKAPCLFRHDGDTLSLEVGDKDSPLSKIKLNLKTGELTASVGLIGKPEWISQTETNGPLGAYDGCSWHYEKTDLEKYDVRLVKLDIWRLKPSGKVLWRFKDSEVVNKESKQAFEVVFEPQTVNAKAGGASLPFQDVDSKASNRLAAAFEICGTIWSWTWIAAGASALISALLCFFPSTLQKANLLGLVGIGLGLAAILAALTGMRLAALQAGLSRNTNGDNLSLIMMTASAPLLAFITARWSRNKLKAAIVAPLSF